MKNLLRAVFCLSLALVAGCSSYDKKFAAASRSDGKRVSPYEGAYSGRWTSSKNSAWGGQLRCVLTKADGSDSDYRADFHATWHGLSSKHSVVLHMKPVARKGRMGFAAGERSFEGTSTLHTIIGAGTYSCSGIVGRKPERDGASFRPLSPPVRMSACYDATYDCGTFEMDRVVTHWSIPLAATDLAGTKYGPRQGAR